LAEGLPPKKSSACPPFAGNINAPVGYFSREVLKPIIAFAFSKDIKSFFI
jgi:hypothetical protein